MIVIHNYETSIAGYLIIFPHRHIEKFCDLTDNERQSITQMISKVQSFIYNLQEVEKCYLLSIGEVTPHFHMHIFPRFSWMIKNKEELIDGGVLFTKMRKKYADSQGIQKNKNMIKVLQEYLRQ